MLDVLNKILYRAQLCFLAPAQVDTLHVLYSRELCILYCSKVNEMLTVFQHVSNVLSGTRVKKRYGSTCTTVRRPVSTLE
jgi:hypothetical protein